MRNGDGLIRKENKIGYVKSYYYPKNDRYRNDRHSKWLNKLIDDWYTTIPIKKRARSYINRLDPTPLFRFIQNNNGVDHDVVYNAAMLKSINKSISRIDFDNLFRSIVSRTSNDYPVVSHNNSLFRKMYVDSNNKLKFIANKSDIRLISRGKRNHIQCLSNNIWCDYIDVPYCETVTLDGKILIVG